MQDEAQQEQTATPAGFAALGLKPELAAAVAALGYEEPTPIQRESIPVLLAGRDLLGQAATGTGKTAAFALPLLHLTTGMELERNKPRALVLVPTRELAMQVAEAVHKYGKALGASVLPIYGGSSFGQQARVLDRGVAVVVATPGRAVDHLTRGTMDLSQVRCVVLDEADEMLDMGFADDLEAILSRAPVGTLFLELCTPRAGDGRLLAQLPRDKRIGIGAVNQKRPEVETADEICARIGPLVELLGPQRVLLNPDCGFATFADNPLASAAIAQRKLAAIVEASAQLRARFSRG